MLPLCRSPRCLCLFLSVLLSSESFRSWGDAATAPQRHKKKEKRENDIQADTGGPFFCFDLRSACHNGQSRRRERRQGGIGSMIMEREGSQFERACFSADAAGYFAGSKYHPRSATPHEGDSTTAGPEVSDGRAHPPNAALCKVPGTAL